MDKSVWEEAIGEDADEEGIGSHDRCKEGICAEKEEGISIVERGKGRSKGVHPGAVKEEVHSAIQVISNGAGILCGEEEWKKENSARLQAPQ